MSALFCFLLLFVVIAAQRSSNVILHKIFIDRGAANVTVLVDEANRSILTTIRARSPWRALRTTLAYEGSSAESVISQAKMFTTRNLTGASTDSRHQISIQLSSGPAVQDLSWSLSSQSAKELASGLAENNSLWGDQYRQMLLLLSTFGQPSPPIREAQHNVADEMLRLRVKLAKPVKVIRDPAAGF